MQGDPSLFHSWIVLVKGKQSAGRFGVVDQSVAEQQFVTVSHQRTGIGLPPGRIKIAVDALY